MLILSLRLGFLLLQLKKKPENPKASRVGKVTPATLPLLTREPLSLTRLLSPTHLDLVRPTRERAIQPDKRGVRPMPLSKNRSTIAHTRQPFARSTNDPNVAHTLCPGRQSHTPRTLVSSRVRWWSIQPFSPNSKP